MLTATSITYERAIIYENAGILKEGWVEFCFFGGLNTTFIAFFGIFLHFSMWIGNTFGAVSTVLIWVLFKQTKRLY
jgi:hypothetical protein